ncbi:MAG: ABC transporter substrate-binding protein [Anaerolineae bacterium]|nr:ABC transporter substrate-binding protein [Anaerolineae bacterium]
MAKRSFTILTVMMALVIMVAACRPAPQALKVAILAPLSGDVATFGNSTRDGALLAIEEWNAKGGVLGRKIEAVVEDSQCEAEPATSAANKVINEDRVKFIIGEVCSKASIPVSEVVDATGGKVLQITPTSTNPKVTIREDGTAKPTVFRACFIDPFQGTVAAKFALEELGAKTAAVFLDQGNDYVRGLAEFFRDAFEAGGGKVVVWETYTAGDTDFTAILTKVKDANPDVLFLPDYYSTVNVIAAQANQMGITAVKLGGDGWDSPKLDRAATAGGFFTNHYTSEDTRPVVQEFVKKYQDKYGSVPDALAALAYDAANLLLMAIQQAGTDDPMKVAQALEQGKFSVISGDIVFDKQHNPKKCAVILEVNPDKVSYRATVCP